MGTGKVSVINDCEHQVDRKNCCTLELFATSSLVTLHVPQHFGNPGLGFPGAIGRPSTKTTL